VLFGKPHREKKRCGSERKKEKENLGRVVIRTDRGGGKMGYRESSYPKKRRSKKNRQKKRGRTPMCGHKGHKVRGRFESERGKKRKGGIKR